ARALADLRVRGVGRVEVRDQRHDPRGPSAIDLRRLEAVAEQRLRRDDRRAGIATDRVADHHRPGRVKPAGDTSDGERRAAAEERGHDDQGKSGAGAHLRPLYVRRSYTGFWLYETVCAVFTIFAGRSGPSSGRTSVNCVAPSVV